MKGLWSTEGERAAKVSREDGHACTQTRTERRDNTSHNTTKRYDDEMIIILFIFIIITTTGI